MVSGPEQEEAYAQMAEAADKLTEVAHELDSVKQAVRQAGSAEDAEKLRREAAATIADVASMLRRTAPPPPSPRRAPAAACTRKAGSKHLNWQAVPIRIGNAACSPAAA